MKTFGIDIDTVICLMATACAPLRDAERAMAVRAEDGQWAFENDALCVSVHGTNAAWTVTDKRCGRVWRQAAEESPVRVASVVPLAAPARGVGLAFMYADGTNAPIPLTARISLAPGTADVVYEVSGDAETVFREIALPSPFVLEGAEARHVIPHNAGLLFGVDELAWDGKALGGFLSMPWFGTADLESGQGVIGILDTPDDAAYRGKKVRGGAGDVLAVQPYFMPQKGEFGYPRRIIYHFADTGGYVALAKRYRAYAKTRGLVKTLEQKRTERPAIDRLVGAVNIYCSDSRNMEELRKLGVERAVISGFTKENVSKINAMGYLSSRYDIYTDLYEPKAPSAKWERCEGFSFPQDVIKNADGSNQIGWCPHTDPKTGEKFPSYVICWQCGLRTLREKMPKRLSESPFTAYFLDCVAATRLYECYDPEHPLTRTADRETRVGQLDYLTHGLGLVAGSEQGRDWAVPVADYFEGVMSTAAFFANPKEIHQMPFETLARDPKFARYEEYGINPGCRVPLFQLVYGDCCETTWRWGDNSHRMPYLWRAKDLLAMVHAAMPTWVLWKPQQELFTSRPERFKACYDNVCRWRRAVGYSEMVNHERLTKDGLVQRSTFANGSSVTVNFADEARRAGGVELPPHSYLVTGDTAEREGLRVGVPVRVDE
jgi:hypothetical protein